MMQIAKTSFYILFACSFACFSAHALNFVSSARLLSITYQKSNDFIPIQGEIGYRSESFFTLEDSFQVAQGSFLLGRRDKDQRFRYYSEGNGSIAFNSSTYQTFFFPETYVEFQNHASAPAFTVGRKKFNFSKADENFQLGLWQPRFRWNYFEPEQLGFTGLFLEQDFGPIQVLAFGTGIFLPDQGPSFQIDNGTIKGSPFFNAPAASMPIFDQQTQIRYGVDYSNVSKIVLQPSFIGRVHAGKEHGPQAQFSYGNKPLNTLFTSIDGYLELPSNMAVVTIQPRSIRQEIASLGLGYRFKHAEIWTEATRDFLKDENNSSSYLVNQQSSNSQILSFGSSAKLFETNGQPLQISQSYFYRQGGTGADSGKFAKAGQSFFENRIPFKQALGFGVRSPIPFTSAKFAPYYKSDFVFDLSNQSSALLQAIEVKVARSWNIDLGVDLIGAQTNRPVSVEDIDILTKFKGNDRFYAGIHYVF